jgi:RNA-directed DNA polymerase
MIGITKLTWHWNISADPYLSSDKKTEELLGGMSPNETAFLGPMNSQTIEYNMSEWRFHSYVIYISWTKVKNHFKTGPAKSLLLSEKRLYLNDGTYEKYIDLAVSYIMGPSRSIPAQIPTHNTIPQERNTLEIHRNSRRESEQLVNTHNTYNGNLGKEYTRITAPKLTEIALHTPKEEYKQKVFARIIEILWGTMLIITCIWSKINLDLCNSDGGKIIEKANASGNTKDSETYERRSYNRKTHTMWQSLTPHIGLNSTRLGNTSQWLSGRRQLSTGLGQDLPSPVQSTKSLDKLKWENIDWNEFNEKVTNGQKKLVTLVGNKGKYSSEVARLQVDLSKTLPFRAMAVRKVISNQGSRTPGYDGIILETPNQKIEMIQTLKDILTNVEKQGKYIAIPVRRVMIPKANGKLRPLGIPTIRDRCLQQLLNLVLTPVVEMYSDNNSFGFRPYRGAKNAVAAVRTDLQSGREWKWVLDADIKGFFDNIHHDWIMNNLPLPRMHKIIMKGWLKSGAIQKTSKFEEEFIETISGTPQGSIISPTISNFVLNGLEECIQRSISDITGGKAFRKNIYKNGIRTKMLTLHIKTIRYADDFVVIANSRRIIELKIKPAIVNFLKERGVSLSKEKTKLFSIYSGRELNFLGYTFKYQDVWRFKHNLFKDRLGKSGIALYPNKMKLKAIKIKLREIFRTSSNKSAYEVISKVNPIIRGWSNYFNLGESVRFRDYLRHFLYKECWRWALKKHPKWGKRSIAETYFLGSQTKRAGLEMGLPGSHKWAFYGVTKSSSRYSRLDTGKERVLVDPTTVVETVAGRTFAIPKDLLHIHAYHEDINKVVEFLTKANFKSLGKSTGMKGKLSIKQKGKCPICGDSLFKDELGNIDILNFNNLEVDHAKPISKGGSKTSLENLRLLHLTCHRKLTKDTFCSHNIDS